MVRQKREVGVSEAKGEWTLVRQRREVGISEAKGEVGIGKAKEGSGHE